MKKKTCISYALDSTHVGMIEREFIEAIVGPVGRSTLDGRDWDAVAGRAAQVAYADYFCSRHGTHDLFEKWVYYNNNPIPNSMSRASLVATIVVEIRAVGAKVLGYGSSEDGYSTAIVVDCGLLTQRELDDVVDIAVRREAMRVCSSA